MNLTHVRFAGAPARSLGQCAARPASPRALVFHDSPPGDEPVPDGLAASILSRHGLDATAYRRRPLERRAGACLRALTAKSDADAEARLDDALAANAALNALLIGVSAFFRDGAVFDGLRATVIPALRASGRPPRVWSAGCSDGAELFSVAMLLAEAGLIDLATLHGTDCRQDAVLRAAQGRFDGQALADVDPDLRHRYFTETNRGWDVNASLRRRAEWRVADVTGRAEAGPWDLVLCRNVAIYLRHPIADDMFGRIAETLAPGGFLVVGKAERPSCAGLTAVSHCIYRR
jgi:chemotaxis protein methyltransferase CheR